jgi:hypothetical protein
MLTESSTRILWKRKKRLIPPFFEVYTIQSTGMSGERKKK